MNTPIPEGRKVTRLLTLIAVLLALLTFGFAAAAGTALYGYHQLVRARENPDRAAAPMFQEIVRRQKTLSGQLRQRSDEASRDLVRLEKRRANLAEIQKGPLQKFDQVLQFTQLLCDQVLLLERQLTEVERMAGETLEPLPPPQPLSTQKP